MAKAPTKEVAVVGNNSALPAYLQGVNADHGLEGLDASDFIIPRIKLLQGTSEEPKVHEEAKVDEFWLNVMDIPIGKVFEFTPLINRKRYMLLAPMEDSKGVLARADDGVNWRPDKGEWQVKMKGHRELITWKLEAPTVRESGLAEFGTAVPGDPDSNPAATLFYDFLVLLHGVPEVQSPVMISLARSSAKKGRDLNGKIGFGSAPMQARKFRAWTVADSNSDGQDFSNWQFGASGFVEEDYYLKAKKLADQFKKTAFRAADDDDTGEAKAPTADSKDY